MILPIVDVFYEIRTQARISLEYWDRPGRNEEDLGDSI